MSGFIGLRGPSDWNINQSKYDETDMMPLMTSPGPALLILGCYLFFVLKIGPAYMKNREPFKLKGLLLVYNAAQVIFSVYLVNKYLGYINKYGLFAPRCNMYDEKLRPEVLLCIWLYFAAKVSELLDTIFFVLRKKNNQVTFLHLYHHSIMMIGTWAFLKYAPSDNVIYIGFINSLVHVFMYTYYALAALGPNVAKYLFWKKYMTSFQLIQFVSIVIQYVVSVKFSECPPSKGVAIFFVLNTAFFFFLFLKFYRKSYVKNMKNKSDISISNELKSS